VTLRLADDVDVSRGDVIAAAETPPTLRRTADAVLCWLSEHSLAPGARVLVSHGTRTVRALVTEIHDRLDIATLTLQPASGAELNDLVSVSLAFAEPLPVEPYATSRDAGSLLVIDAHDGWTLAAGMVDAVIPGATASGAAAATAPEPADEEPWL